MSASGTSRNNPVAYPSRVEVLTMPACAVDMPKDEPINATRICGADRLVTMTPVARAPSRMKERETVC
ncbi:hypothetical protein BN961_01730 [Afipia felis]|uniref:Uncharacterized protein n=1 Tax=Afipia felis TaxID=1035 RepID=A0A090MLQ0_AFIFE|nr:hypothetical protein BN961_01730 [Afipia felis]